MRIAEYKQISTRTEQRVNHHDAEHDECGNITVEAWDEIVEVEVPVMGMVCRDASPEEIAEFESQQAEMPELSPSDLREQAYNTEPCVLWDGSMLTVTQAAQQWQYYAAEGRTDKTDALTALIAAAKEKIRAEWPDGEESTDE